MRMAHDQVCFIRYSTLILVLTIPPKFRRGFPSGDNDGHLWTHWLAQSFYSDKKCELPHRASGEQCITFFSCPSSLHLLLAPSLGSYWDYHCLTLSFIVGLLQLHPSLCHSISLSAFSVFGVSIFPDLPMRIIWFTDTRKPTDSLHIYIITTHRTALHSLHLTHNSFLG